MDANRSTFLHDKENAFFWKRFSVDRAYIFILKPVNLHSSISDMNNVMQRLPLTDHTTYLKTYNLDFSVNFKGERIFVFISRSFPVSVGSFSLACVESISARVIERKLGASALTQAETLSTQATFNLTR